VPTHSLTHTAGKINKGVDGGVYADILSGQKR
jgi:hypothetical protein